MGVSPVTHDDRVAMLAEIRAAFDRVTRKGGVSWSGAYAADVYDSPPSTDDPDRHWFDLATSPAWCIDPGLGGFSFLDPIGFRYYLAAAMYKLVVDPGCGDITFHLTLDEQGKCKTDQWRLHKWSRLDDRQRRTVARFLAYMHLEQRQDPDMPPSACDESDYWCLYPDGHALIRYWNRYLEAGGATGRSKQR